MKSELNIWKLLQQASKTTQKTDPECPSCGLSLRGFRQAGKLGCPHCYETFAQQLEPLLLRMHNASRHTGRVPGQSPAERQRIDLLRDLQRKLESAVREEDYEDAARLRDEIQALERTPE